ncbi:DNA-directed RNA polymerase [Methanococcus voltae]|uniref:DNA-directed RNA polymerase subunit Rpo7 n=1 Tax=Methanococcus voltae TaxID=2188 RepID=A0A8J7URA7_METVO|nr:DNA-directed RNA polymerase [Methanococcus voltae]MBP2172495.1 DNA-directed RNA polymerase subunit E' [Methanococcus voltae]MBP2201598.1 DNA-directed RNA polymerase subunit E' [Methanococcus voltae]
MYKILTIEDTIRIPPKMFGNPLKENVQKVLMEKYEGILDKELGFILAIEDIDQISEGDIIYGDGAAYHDTTFNILTYEPEVHEIIEGEIVDIVEFGAFIRLGPLDGLIHISQVMDDYVAFDPQREAIIGKETGKVLEKGDKVRARIVAVSLKEDRKRGSKIALTMRQPALGKLEWLEEQKLEAMENAE